MKLAYLFTGFVKSIKCINIFTSADIVPQIIQDVDEFRIMLSENFPIYGVDLGSLLLEFDPPALSVLPTVGTPTLIVTGDTINPDLRIIMESLQRGIHDARRVVIPHAGYLANIEKPAEFNRIVLDWLSKQPAGDGRTEIRT